MVKTKRWSCCAGRPAQMEAKSGDEDFMGWKQGQKARYLGSMVEGWKTHSNKGNKDDRCNILIDG